MAVIGCGRMGLVRADACRTLGARVVALYDIDPGAASRLAARHADARIVNHLSNLDWPRIDAAFICTPPGARVHGAVAAIRAGVPVLMEKPIGPDADVIALELAANPVVTAVGYMNRYRPSVLRLRDQLCEGRVIGITCQWAAPPYERDWWQKPNGGALNDYATHLVDLCRFLIGDIRAVRALKSAPLSNSSGGVCLAFENGACGTLFYSSEAHEKNIAVDVFWTSGHARLEGWDLRDAERAEDESVDPFVEETHAFLQAVGDPSSSRLLCDFEDARHTQEAVDAIARSALSTTE